ncbi:MAG: hypothetical protein AABX79_03220 [Nanoarchaeota archaeon]
MPKKVKMKSKKKKGEQPFSERETEETETVDEDFSGDESDEASPGIEEEY